MNQGLRLSTRSVNRLRDACAIIDGIPEGNVWLAKWETKAPNGDLTKAVRCPGLWLMTHPTFAGNLGMHANGSLFEAFYLELVAHANDPEYVPVYQRAGARKYGSYLLSEILEISPQEAAHLFRPISERELERGLPDKVHWRTRALNLIKKIEAVHARNPYQTSVDVQTEIGIRQKPSANDLNYTLSA
ncbi:hypothetical protein D3C87_278750 [compost metagenome]